jgi:ribosome maturation factor RimP
VGSVPTPFLSSYDHHAHQAKGVTMALIDRLRALVMPVVDDLGLELYDFEYAGGVLRVTVDRPGGVGMDSIAEVTRMVSRELDHTDPIDHAFSLEVSSPGLERTLRTPAHFAGAVGLVVNVKLLPGTQGDRRVVGTLTAASDVEVTIVGDGFERMLPLDDIERARTVFEWASQPKPGGPRPAPSRVPVTAAIEEERS